MSPLANMTRWHFFHVKVKQLLFIKKKKVKQLLKVTCFIYLLFILSGLPILDHR